MASKDSQETVNIFHQRVNKHFNVDLRLLQILSLSLFVRDDTSQMQSNLIISVYFVFIEASTLPHISQTFFNKRNHFSAVIVNGFKNHRGTGKDEKIATAIANYESQIKNALFHHVAKCYKMTS